MQITVKRLTDTKVRFSYEYSKKYFFNHQIEFPNYIHPLDDSLFRIALLSRPVNSNSYTIAGINIEKELKHFFEVSLQAPINVKISNHSSLHKNHITYIPDDSFLCFSGGFDSISAKAILDSSVNLVSIDFGGKFKREAHFFKSFDTNIIKWNIRDNNLLKKSQDHRLLTSPTSLFHRFDGSLDWRFLLSPALLFRKEHRPIGIATGSIMESSSSWFTHKKPSNYFHYDENQFGSSTTLLSPVACLSEYSTTLIASEYLNTKQLDLSLNSLAPAFSLKSFRKKVLLAIIKGNSLPSAPKTMNKHHFGSGFTDDYLALYLSWKCGKEWVLNNYCDYLPEEITKIDMSFTEKYNQQNLYLLDDVLRNIILNKLKLYGIEACTKKDLLEIEKVRRIIIFHKYKQKTFYSQVKTLKNNIFNEIKRTYN